MAAKATPAPTPRVRRHAAVAGEIEVNVRKQDVVCQVADALFGARQLAPEYFRVGPAAGTDYGRGLIVVRLPEQVFQFHPPARAQRTAHGRAKQYTGGVGEIAAPLVHRVDGAVRVCATFESGIAGVDELVTAGSPVVVNGMQADVRRKVQAGFGAQVETGTALRAGLGGGGQGQRKGRRQYEQSCREYHLTASRYGLRFG